MNFSRLHRLAAIAAMAAIGLTSCQKEANTIDFSSSEGEAMISTIGNSVEEDVDAVSYRVSNAEVSTGCHVCHFKDRIPECATLTESSQAFPKNITIDYGDGCEDHRGTVKKGKVIIELTADMTTEGAIRTVSFESFFVNDRAVSGTRVNTNIGKNEQGNWVFSRSVNLVITRTDGTTITKAGSGQKEWIAGFDTDDCLDNEFYLTGSGSVVRSDGKTASRVITTPLHVDRSCRYIISGVVEMTHEHKSSSIDFGNGVCDDVATITKDGEIRVIDLDDCRVGRKGRR